MKTVEILQPVDFFRTQVSTAATSLGVELKVDLEFYLVNLLCEFINPAQLQLDEKMGVLDTPLALMLKKALESSPEMQIKVYKRLGDTSLYFAGYFQDYIQKKTVDLNYYVDMGSAAYERTSHLLRSQKNDTHFSGMYLELSQEFRKLVSVITEVSGLLNHSSKKDSKTSFEYPGLNKLDQIKGLTGDEILLNFQANTKEPS